MGIRIGLLGLLLACTSARRRVDGVVVRDIDFEGNGGALSGHNAYQLRAAMVQRQSAVGLLTWPLTYSVKPEVYRPDELLRDGYRLEVWYMHHGWFDASFRGWQVRTLRRATRRRAEVIDAIGVVDPGPRSLVTRLEVRGMDGVLAGIRSAVLRRAPIQPGDGFDLELVEATAAALQDTLRNRSRPYATVSFAVDARPEELGVDVVFEVDPGRIGQFGAITVIGADRVDEALVRDRLELVFREGDRYVHADLGVAQRALFQMGTFSIVTVQPDLSDPTRSDVPVVVRLTESRFWTVRLGAGGTYDSFLPEVRGTASVRRSNLARRLITADLGAQAGYAFAPGTEAVSSIPIWGLTLSLDYPNLISRRGGLELDAAVEQDIYAGLWAYRRPRADLRLVVGAGDDVQLRVGPHFEQYTFLLDALGDTPEVRAAQLRLFGVEDQGDFQYQLTAFDQFLTFDYRDDPIRTARGSYYALSMRQAVPLTSSGYGFVRATGEARGYLPLGGQARWAAFPLTLTGKIRGTATFPYGPTEVVPLPERTFLGGSTSIRGFRPSQVGPYTTLCVEETVRGGGLFGGSDPTTQVTRYHLPNGALASADGSLELRYQWLYGVTFAAFADLGWLGDHVSEVSPDNLRGSVGLGARYDTSVGAVRLDVSVRPLYPEDAGPTRYTQCAPADKRDRVNDLFDNLDPLFPEHPPLALVFFITIGESI